MDTHDTLNRRNRYRRTSTGKKVSLKSRDLRWLEALRDHGPLPSTYLHAFTEDLAPCKKSSRVRLTDLFNEARTPDDGPYLARPVQQRCFLNALNQPLVYDLGEAAWKALGQRKSDIHRPNGPFAHQLMVSTVTASIEIMCLRTQGIRYIPGWQLLQRAGANIGVELLLNLPGRDWPERHKLIPDQLFALEYQIGPQKRYLAFIVECDRGTEPILSSNTARKSYLRSYHEYRHFVGTGLYREAYGIKANCMVLNVMNSPRRKTSYMRLVERESAGKNSFMLFQAIQGFEAVPKVPDVHAHLWSGPWQRTGNEDVVLASLGIN